MRTNIYSIDAEKTILSYKGEFDGETIGDLVRLVERKMFLVNESVKTTKTLVNILIESLQNVCHYFQEGIADTNTFRESFLIIGNNNDSYQLYVGNYVTKIRAQALKKRVDNVAQMSSDDLRSVYITILEMPKIYTGGGAGLGFIDMTRRANGNIKYHFEAENEDKILFVLEASIESTKKTS